MTSQCIHVPHTCPTHKADSVSQWQSVRVTRHRDMANKRQNATPTLWGWTNGPKKVLLDRHRSKLRRRRQKKLSRQGYDPCPHLLNQFLDSESTLQGRDPWFSPKRSIAVYLLNSREKAGHSGTRSKLSLVTVDPNHH